LRQLHLQPTFSGARATGEDIEDHLSAVDNAHRADSFQIALLGGRQFVIYDDDFGAGCNCQIAQFGNFALAKESGGLDIRFDLICLADRENARAARKFGQFQKGFGGTARNRSTAALKSGENRLFRCLLQRDGRR
jgi:hypothetical protein